MATNKNFVVQNGLQVGPLTIFAGNGDVFTTGNVTSFLSQSSSPSGSIPSGNNGQLQYNSSGTLLATNYISFSTPSTRPEAMRYGIDPGCRPSCLAPLRPIVKESLPILPYFIIALA